jgi:ferredoxin-type protein NapH
LITNNQKSKYSKWRVFSLVSIYVLFVVHIIHWQLNETTLAPLELNELLYTLESGIVTAGFLLMVIAAFSVVIFGRFFCSWLCHILAFQDLCHWMLSKVGIRPKAIRSRVLWIVPLFVMAYMFVWPQLKRIWRGEIFPKIRIEGATSDWASFITDDFWRNLPDPWVAGATFLVCGFIIVYVLGSRGFCANVCPYGALFSLADKIAPGKIILSGDCDQCGICTAQCDSNIRIHTEIDKYGKVVDSNCLKDMDCVSVCPKQALSFGFTKPTLFTAGVRTQRQQLPSHFSFVEELVILCTFIFSLLIYRGLYDSVPFLMALGLAAILSYLSIILLRLFNRTSMRFNRLWLKKNSQILFGGWVFLSVLILLFIFSLHSGVIRWHEYKGSQALIKANIMASQKQSNISIESAQISLQHFLFIERWGIFKSTALLRKIGTAYDITGNNGEAKIYFSKVLSSNSDDLIIQWKMISYLIQDNKPLRARLALISLTELSLAKRHIPLKEKQILAQAHKILGDFHLENQEYNRALTEYKLALKYMPNFNAVKEAIQGINDYH